MSSFNKISELPPSPPPPPSPPLPPRASDSDTSSDDDDENDGSVWYTPSELRDILDRSTQYKLLGNTQFGKGEFEEAMKSYKEGLVELPVRTKLGKGKGKGRAIEGEAEEDKISEVLSAVKLDGENSDGAEGGKEVENVDEEEEELRELRAVLFANVAACLIKLPVRPYLPLSHIFPDLVPPLTIHLHKTDQKTLSTLPGITPLVAKSSKEALASLPPKIAEAQEREKDEVMGKLKDLGNSVLGKFGLNTDNFKFVQQPGGGYSMNFER
ncbi:hypothetical protein P7C70_g6756, partial [Phenoliferia sp. Uapishka_3]